MAAKWRKPGRANGRAVEPLNGRRLTSILIALFALIAFYWLAWVTGATFAYQGLALDTCWLIRLGETISVTGAVPKVDPYTFTLPTTLPATLPASLLIPTHEAKPFVLYQWLSEVVFYNVYHYFDAKGLLVFCAWITALTFLTIPLRSSLRNSSSLLWSAVLIILAVLSAYFRYLVRPEIFTCFLLVLWLALLRPLRVEVDDGAEAAPYRGINWIVVVCLTVCSFVWCNMHSGFISGLILLAIYAMAFSGQDIYQGRRFSSRTRTIFLALPTCVLATLFNPYGIGLWLYLPNLFFSPVNDHINELRPLDWQALIGMHPFLLCFMVLSYTGVAFRVWQWRNSLARVFSPLSFMSIAIILIATGLCIFRRRLISISVLLMLFESTNFMFPVQAPGKSSTELWHRKISYVVLELLVLCFAWRGVVDVSLSGIPIVIPQFTRVVVPPFKGVEFLEKNYQGGRIFSSADLSNMLEFYIKPKAAIFADTRYDAYPIDILRQQEVILKAIGNWRELIDSYKITWIFVRSDAPVGTKLEGDPKWVLVYKDSQCKILKRQQGETK
jgi:hypothetical protein